MPMQHRPGEIKDFHLARKALIYVRQSSESQVRDNQGSAEYQRGLAELAASWGWPRSQIDIIEDDQALTATAAEHRRGLQRMIALIRADEVGAVFVGDDSRLSRAAVVTLGLLAECVPRRVLLVKDRAVLNLNDPTGHFQAALGAILAEFDNDRRREHIRRGRDARLAAGKAVTRPPAGYVWGDDRAWDLDPDPAVQSAIRTLYRTFFQERSILGTVRALRRMGHELPRRPSPRRLVWRAPTASNVRGFLKSPQYTGAYLFRRLVSDPTLGRDKRGVPRLRRARPEEQIHIPGHHQGYLTQAERDEIQAILKARAPLPERRNLGPGRALLQGLVRCGLHPRYKLSALYKQRANLHYYGCVGTQQMGGKQCRIVSGQRLDRAVVEAVLARLAPPRVAALRSAWHDVCARRRDEDDLQDVQYRRARRAVEDAERRYLAVDPQNRLVAASLEARLEQAKRELRALELAANRRPVTHERPVEADLRALEEIALDAPTLFAAPTTTDRDRKEIIRALVDGVMVEKMSPQWIQARLSWADGAPDVTLQVRGPLYGRMRVLELAASGASVEEICRQADAEGLTTRNGGAWSLRGVRFARWRGLRRNLKRDEKAPSERNSLRRKADPSEGTSRLTRGSRSNTHSL
jgi:DNA invertase Pin-like site-specific DNA recombinase